MSDDLVKRLRQDINETDTFGRRKNWTEQRSERRKAADRIEAQAAEIERLRTSSAKAVMNALWPILGGNHTDAELWQEINDAVVAALTGDET